MFETLGYDIIDSLTLADEYCRQAARKYADGNFKLSYLDEFGQRININIELPSKDGSRNVIVQSSWIVYPNGEIQLVTADRGKNK